MWPFKKKPDEGISAVPEEIQDYYAAERRGRTGIAWLLALATLLTTLALAAVIFLGGRWAYRKIHHPSTGTTSQPNPPSQPIATPAPPKTSTTPKTPHKSKSTKKVAPKVSAKPPITAQSKNLSNTGPGNILGLFAVTTLLASTGHYIFKLKSLRYKD